MAYRYRRKTKSMKPIYVTLVILLLLIVTYIGLQENPFQEITEEPTKTLEEPSVSLKEVSTISLNIPAVDTNGNGLNTVLKVTANPGTGKALTDIDVLLFGLTHQQSIQTARKVAEEITGIDTNKIDLEYSIKADNATVVGGPSAGAALTIATIAVLQNKNLKENVVITGTINEDGKIGRVGAIVEKAEAAKEAGAEIFIVPTGESSQTYIRPDEKCIKTPGFVYCETVYRQLRVNVGESIGIEVIEIDNIRESIDYFFE